MSHSAARGCRHTSDETNDGLLGTALLDELCGFFLCTATNLSNQDNTLAKLAHENAERLQKEN